MSFRSPEEVFAWAESFTNFERGQLPSDKRAYRLDRMRTLLAMFDDPAAAFRSFHVAGTKGKGSTATMMAAVLSAAGRRTGLYTSPHVATPLERIFVDGAPPEPQLFMRIGDGVQARVAEASDRMPGGFSPTTFELYTLLAFLAFRETGCRDAVIEVGIGGRLDATNVISPEAAVITALDLEHTDVLGDTLAQIAREKAGIIKDGVPVSAAPQPPEARAVLREVSAERNAPLAFLDEELEELSIIPSPAGTACTVRLRGRPPLAFSLAMLGDFQAENAALAWLALGAARPGITLEQFRSGFGAARLPGRMELVPGRPVVVLDGAHTPLAVRRLLESFRRLYPRGGCLLFGSVAGKNPRGMAAILAPAFERVVISTPGRFKESDPGQVAAIFRELNPATELVPDPARALERARALADDGPVLVTGSFYLVAEVRPLALGERRGA